jgi:hypothetical protein
MYSVISRWFCSSSCASGRSERFRERTLLFPIGLGIYGVVLLSDTPKHHTLSVASTALLFPSAVASLGFGVLRGRTIELFIRGGELWERASWTTIAAGRGALLLTRVALIGIAAAIGAQVAASPTSIPLMLAITLGAQMIVVRQRARATAVRVARLGERGGAPVVDGPSRRPRSGDRHAMPSWGDGPHPSGSRRAARGPARRESRRSRASFRPR